MGAAPRPAAAAPPAALAGTYRIENWQALQERGLYHFFYLHPQGRFLLAAAWPGHETSRFAGTWRVRNGRLSLRGRGWVETNQGDWRTDFARAFRVRRDGGTVRLEPVPRKNRYGLMGWPDAFVRHSADPAPNLPRGDLPADAAALLERIRALLGE